MGLNWIRDGSIDRFTSSDLVLDFLNVVMSWTKGVDIKVWLKPSSHFRDIWSSSLLISVKEKQDEETDVHSLDSNCLTRRDTDEGWGDDAKRGRWREDFKHGAKDSIGRPWLCDSILLRLCSVIRVLIVGKREECDDDMVFDWFLWLGITTPWLFDSINNWHASSSLSSRLMKESFNGTWVLVFRSSFKTLGLRWLAIEMLRNLSGKTESLLWLVLIRDSFELDCSALVLDSRLLCLPLGLHKSHSIQISRLFFLEWSINGSWLIKSNLLSASWKATDSIIVSSLDGIVSDLDERLVLLSSLIELKVTDDLLSLS